MTQSGEIMLQVTSKAKKEWFTGFRRCKACKMYWTEANNCTRKPPEKIEVERSQKCPRPAGLAPIYALWCSPLAGILLTQFLVYVLQVLRPKTSVKALKNSSPKIYSKNLRKFTTIPSLFHSSIYCSPTGKKPPVCLFLSVCSKESP